MAALRGHLANINKGEAVTEEIDWFVFTKRQWPSRTWMRWKISPTDRLSASPTAKKTVDARALNRHVVDVLRRELTSSSPVRVVEVGAGVER
jgi:hypothetical protein